MADFSSASYSDVSDGDLDTFCPNYDTNVNFYWTHLSKGCQYLTIHWPMHHKKRLRPLQQISWGSPWRYGLLQIFWISIWCFSFQKIILLYDDQCFFKTWHFSVGWFYQSEHWLTMIIVWEKSQLILIFNYYFQLIQYQLNQ